MKDNLVGLSVGLIAGLLLSLVSIFTLELTVLIAIPRIIVAAIRDYSFGSAVMYLWDFIVVQLMGAGVLALLVTYLAVKYLPGSTLWKSFGIVVGALGLMYVVQPDVLTAVNIGQRLYELVIVSCVFSFVYLHLKKGSVEQDD